MNARRWLLYLAVAIPPLVLAAVGVSHPTDLTAASAEYWRNLHIGILPVFPLLAFGPWLVVRGHNAIVSWTVGVLAFVYAAFYTALDVLAGIGAGGLKLDDMGMATGTVFGLGNDLGDIGSWAFLLAAAITGVVAILRAHALAIPGALLVVVGAWLFLERHIFFPVGVIGQLCLAAGWVALIVAQRRAVRGGRPLRRAAAGASA